MHYTIQITQYAIHGKAVELGVADGTCRRQRGCKAVNGWFALDPTKILLPPFASSAIPIIIGSGPAVTVHSSHSPAHTGSTASSRRGNDIFWTKPTMITPVVCSNDVSNPSPAARPLTIGTLDREEAWHWRPAGHVARRSSPRGPREPRETPSARCASPPIRLPRV